MDWLSTILSSGIIAAVISYWSGEKNNRLKYITSERSKWRKEIKKIASKLSECKCYDKKVKKYLTELKLRINSYGRKDVYPSDIRLRFLSDEHIWKEIDAIEKGGDYTAHRDRLLRYLELLLKFDWERSKSETKSEKKTLLLTMIFAGVIIISVFVDYALIKGNVLDGNVLEMIKEEIRLIAWQVVILLTLLFPTFVDYIGFSKPEESYNRFGVQFASFLAGELLALFYWMWVVISNEQSVFWVFCYLEIVLGLPFVVQEVNKKRNYRDYRYGVMACFTDEPLLIYSNNSLFQDLGTMFGVEPIMNNYEITYKKICNLDTLKDQEIEKLGIEWNYVLKFNKMKIKNPELTKKEFFAKYPKACKIFVKRGDKIVCGYKKKDWEQIANGIAKNN